MKVDEVLSNIISTLGILLQLSVCDLRGWIPKSDYSDGVVVVGGKSVIVRFRQLLLCLLSPLCDVDLSDEILS